MTFLSGHVFECHDVHPSVLCPLEFALDNRNGRNQIRYVFFSGRNVRNKSFAVRNNSPLLDVGSPRISSWYKHNRVGEEEMNSFTRKEKRTRQASRQVCMLFNMLAERRFEGCMQWFYSSKTTQSTRQCRVAPHTSLWQTLPGFLWLLIILAPP